MNKIGFLFLTYHNTSCPFLWDDFFNKANPDKYRIFCHSKYPHLVSDFLKDHIISKYTQTSWAHSSLVKATFMLMEESIKDSSISHFCLISHNTVPLIPFDEIYSQCMSNEKGYINMYESKEYKHSQWMILSRDFVITTLKYSKKILFAYNIIRKQNEGNKAPLDEYWVSFLFHRFLDDEIEKYFQSTHNSKTYVKIVPINMLINRTLNYKHYQNREFTKRYIDANFAVPRVYSFNEFIEIQPNLIQKGYWFLRKLAPYNRINDGSIVYNDTYDDLCNSDSI